MLSYELKVKTNRLWDRFIGMRILIPLTALEQISYLLLLHYIEDEDRKAQEKDSGHKSIFENEDKCRWSYFSGLNDENEILDLVSNSAFPFLKKIYASDHPYYKHINNAVFKIANAQLLKEAINDINSIFSVIEDQSKSDKEFVITHGDIYDYIANKDDIYKHKPYLKTPKHIINFMCELIEPDLNDQICDPSCGKGEFITGAYEHILTKHTDKGNIKDDENGLKRFRVNAGENISKSEEWEKLNSDTLFGFEIDKELATIGLTSLMLHGITTPKIEQLDFLTKEYDKHHSGVEYSVLLGIPPSVSIINKEGISDDLEGYGTRSELLYLVRITHMLRNEGRAAVIITEGVLSGASKPLIKTKETLLRYNSLDAVISLPAGIFNPYTGTKTSILIFRKGEEQSDNYNTKEVWFYELESDGYSLDSNRRKLADNPLPVAIDAYNNRESDTSEKRLTHFYVPIDEIISNEFDLTYNRYKQYEHEYEEYESPPDILKKITELEKSIQKEMGELKDMIG